MGKSREEIREALRARIRLFNVESAAELELLASEASRAGSAAPAAIRVNPDVEAGGHPHISTGHHTHKFGIDWEHARRFICNTGTRAGSSGGESARISARRF